MLRLNIKLLKFPQKVIFSFNQKSVFSRFVKSDGIGVSESELGKEYGLIATCFSNTKIQLTH